ncbi:MAG: excinuclease ABC subunit UvrC [Promethearchaeota archaeon]
MSDLELQRKSLPKDPGIYMFKNKNNEIIYVGKAKNLRSRVSQYFGKSTHSDPYYEEKIREMVKNIHSIEYIVTQNEKEALILENLQIKKHFPRFNVIMRDSKSYPWICIFYSEEFPRIRIIRGPEKFAKNNTLLGPYTDKKEIQRILRDLRKIFPYCSCKKKVKKRERPCLYYQIKLCPGPCINAISKEDYLENIKGIELFLKGNTTKLINELQEKMLNAAESQNYELATFWRDKIESINHSTMKQNVLLDSQANKDIINYYLDEQNRYFALVILHVRDGRMSNKSAFLIDLKDKIVLREEILSQLLEQYYQDENHLIPDTIILPQWDEHFALLKEFLLETKKDVKLRVSRDEKEEALLRIAHKNARVMVEQQIQMDAIQEKEEENINTILEKIKELLDMPTIPRRIEGFDISNIEGKNATGSMVYFLDGKPDKKNFRHYNVLSKSTPDDFAMMKEIIKRRYTSLLKKNIELPDLILVDGGRAQLNAGLEVLKELKLSIPIMGLAKRLEEIYLPNKQEPIQLPENSPVLKLFQRIRNEAHRFAKRLHEIKRRKKATGSMLDEINGIGPATRKKLLKTFGSLEAIKKASFEELTRVVNEKIAGEIIKKLNKKTLKK